MSRMNLEAEGLVRAGRAAFKPSDADRDRVLGALLPQLGGGLGGAGANAPSLAPPAAKATLVKVLTVVVGVGAVGGALFLALRPEPPPARVAAAPVKPATAAPGQVDEAPASAVSVLPLAPSTEKPAAVAVRPADTLAEEVAILSRAGSDLHAGRPTVALAALAEHQRRFPRGALAQERTAARVQALCALGRTKEAKLELARLSPSSPHQARARKACGSALTER